MPENASLHVEINMRRNVTNREYSAHTYPQTSKFEVASSVDTATRTRRVLFSSVTQVTLPASAHSVPRFHSCLSSDKAESDENVLIRLRMTN